MESKYFVDIESNLLKNDYILFADVLEHLRNPESVLKWAVDLLKEDGTGMMIMNGGENELPKWTAGEGSLTIYNSNGDPLERFPIR